jgi:hypothetical protein
MIQWKEQADRQTPSISKMPGVTLNREGEKMPSVVQDYRQHMGLID